MKLLPAAVAAFCSLLFAAGFVYLHESQADAAFGVCLSPATKMTRVELIFGTGRSTGEAIRSDEWDGFIETQVTPRFPAGLTVLRGDGQWRNDQGVIGKEAVYVLVIWHERTASLEANVEAIRSAYKSQFAQSSVMRIDGTSCVSF